MTCARVTHGVVCGHELRLHGHGPCIGAYPGSESVCPCIGYVDDEPAPRVPVPDEVVLPPLVGPDTSTGTIPTVGDRTADLQAALDDVHDPSRCPACHRTIVASTRKVGAWVGHTRDCPRRGQRAAP